MRSRVKVTFFVILSALILSVAKDLSAQDFPARPVGMVNDFAGMLSGSERSNLEQRLRTYRDTTSNVVVIATIENLQGYDIQPFATKMFSDWRMWEGDRRNGVLILIARDDRQVRIEVGYGLEAAIPDILAGRIIQEIIIPDFRAGNVYSALVKSTDMIMNLASGEFDAMPQRRTSSASDEDFKNIGVLILIILYIVIQVFSSSRRRRGHRLDGNGIIILHGLASMLGGGRSGGFGGGGGFGGFGGGGGFGSGGGGASGSW
jgi:uncharacterized protein